MLGKLALGAAALTTTIGGGAAAAQTHTFTPHPMGPERQEIHEAISTNDYDTWLDIVTANPNSPFADIASESVFESMVTIHELAASGDTEAARAARESLRTELDLPELEGRSEHRMKRGEKGKRGMLDTEAHNAIHTALEEKDYTVWSQTLKDAGVPEEKITEDHFTRMVERLDTMPKDRGMRGFQR